MLKNVCFRLFSKRYPVIFHSYNYALNSYFSLMRLNLLLCCFKKAHLKTS